MFPGGECLIVGTELSVRESELAEMTKTTIMISNTASPAHGLAGNIVVTTVK